MAKWGNLDGTLKTVFSLSKLAGRVFIRSNSGKLEGQNNGGAWYPLAFNIVSQGSNFTAESGTIYLVTGTISVQLPVPTDGAKFVVKKLGSNVVTLVRNAAEEIDGIAANRELLSTKESVTIISNGTNWFII